MDSSRKTGTPSGAGPRDGRLPPRHTALALIPAALILTLISYVQVSSRSGAGGYDALADWVVVNAAFDGLNVTLPVVELAEHYGVTVAGIEGHEASVHPRTPGGILVMSPLALVEVEAAYPLWVAVAAASTLLLVAWVAKAFALSSHETLIGSLLVIPAGYVVSGSLEFGSLSPLVALLAFAYWRSIDTDGAARGGGLAIGVATTLKVYPGILLLATVALRRWRALAWGVGSILLFNLAGLLVIGTYSLSSYIEVLSLAGREWIPFPGNLSLAGLLTVVGLPVTAASAVGIVAALAWVAFRWTPKGEPDRLLALLVVATLIGWPMVWGHYMILALPAVAWLAVKRGQPSRRLAVLWLVSWIVLPALWVVIDPHASLQQGTLAALQLLLVGAAWIRGRDGLRLSSG